MNYVHVKPNKVTIIDYIARKKNYGTAFYMHKYMYIHVLVIVIYASGALLIHGGA